MMFLIFSDTRLPAVSGTKKQTNRNARKENSARIKKVYTLPWSVSIALRKTLATMKFPSQFVAVARAAAVPTKWIGYISEFMIHGVDDSPMEKNSR